MLRFSEVFAAGYTRLEKDSLNMKVTLSRILGGLVALAFAGLSNAAEPTSAYLRNVVPTAMQTSPSDQSSTDVNVLTASCGACLGANDSCLGCDVRLDACDAAGACDSKCGEKSGLLGFGFIKPSDRCFNDFISPMTNPVFFEDPRTLTEARFIFINHELPAALGGNSVQVYALQMRAALTDRLSIIATKDGLIYTQSPVLDSGYADLSAGLKYNLYRDVERGRLLSSGFTYEIPMGSNRSLQGNGNGEFHFFVTGATRLGEKSHWISASGLREPADTNLENRVWYWSNHLDRQIGNRPLYAFTELNWYNYLSSGTAFGPVEGGDLFNLGASGVTGNDLVTQAIGFKAKPKRNIEAGIAYEFPFTARKGLLENRLTADLIFRY